jgi:lysophospholipase L1-like esterase
MRGFAGVAKSVPVVVAVMPLLTDASREQLDRLHAKVHALLDELALPYLDLSRAMRRYPVRELQLQDDDDTHPNAFGHELIAKELAAWLESNDYFAAAAGAPSASFHAKR